MNDDTNISMKGLLEGKMVLNEDTVNDLISRSSRFDAVMVVLEHISQIYRSNANGVPVDIIDRIVETFGVKE